MEVPTTTTRLLAEAAAIAERLRRHARAPRTTDLLGVLEHHRLLLDATARLAAAVAWLLWRRAVETGELPCMPADPLPALPPAPGSFPPYLPGAAAAALAEAAAFHRRIVRLAGAAQEVGASG